ncbi:Leucine-rich repeat-containing protein [Schistosoma japonicum]|uniref:Leucine-rich repeat-containing protein n=1 Tax=Schistosoma japonicum TaxID=6182 RepID=A0A4Z2CWJ3_SCHJA|nr:Leucine-rich repeat-containing protein [Schistosoma japonicum]
MDLESLNILHEICTINGIHYDNLLNDNFLNQSLIILFTNFKKCISLHNFPYLTELIIISQDITQITKLETCPNLKKLWLCECKLNKIENLTSCKQLNELYLYDNFIKKIENLSNNQQIECLWLNNNQISVIEGLNNLKQLKQLNLSGNYINNLNNNLLYNQKLEIFSISGNYLWNPNDISILSKLPCLTTLNINEPEYLKNPLCYHSNLPILLIYRLPQLCKIDHININLIDLKYAIKSIIQELQMFGYLEIQEINNTDDVFTYCNVLLNSRLCNHDMNNSIVNSLKLLHLYKINNRLLLQRIIFILKAENIV